MRIYRSTELSYYLVIDDDFHKLQSCLIIYSDEFTTFCVISHFQWTNQELLETKDLMCFEEIKDAWDGKVTEILASMEKM